MPLFTFQAIDMRGKRLSGVQDGTSEKEARDKIRMQGLALIKIESKKESAKKNNFSLPELKAFTLQLAELISAKLPLYDAMSALEDQTRGEKHHAILLGICEKLKSGGALSDAMSEYPGSFDTLYVAMVKAGEQSGSLETVFRRLNIYLGKREKLQGQMTTAMIYPLVLCVFSLVVIGLLLGYVVPSIEGLFEGREMNGFTKSVIAISHFITNWWWIYLPLIVSLGAFIGYKLKTGSGKRVLQKLTLKLPLVKKLTIYSAVARFSRTMSTLMAGGLPIIESIRISTKVISNPILEEDMKRVEEMIVEGGSLSSELSKIKWVPSLVAKMLMVGEEAGSQETMFNKIADMYEDDVEKMIDRIMALSQPAILVVMGGIVAMIMLAVLLPLTDIPNF